MPDASGDNVMVHCTDIAGSVGCSIGQVKPGHDRMRRHAPNGAPGEHDPLPRSSAGGCFGRNGRRQPLFFLKAVTKRKHHKGRDDDPV